MSVVAGIVFGFIVWFLMRYLVAGIYTVDQNERAVKTIFGRAERLTDAAIDDPYAEYLRPEERERYRYPQVVVIPPGGPYFKWPWERIYKVSVATQTMNMALDLENPMANQGGTKLEAVTKDQLNIALEGQIRYRVYERNLYAYLWGVKKPDRPRDGILHFHSARANRQLRGAATRNNDGDGANGRQHGRQRLDQRSAQEPA
jgi:regulator of protease activity HflC (stomatin/prohibitin superfamily)